MAIVLVKDTSPTGAEGATAARSALTTTPRYRKSAAATETTACPSSE